MGRALVGITFAIALGAGLVACGDPLLCKSDVFVAVQTTGITTDLDVAPGVQGDLRIRTSLDEGELVSVTIIDAEGHVASTSSAAVDELGNATIRATFPLPHVTVQASATSLCGEGRDEVMIDVLPGTGCDVTLEPAPVANAFYAPLGVLAASADLDSGTAGFQATVKVATRADWTVDLFVTSSNGEVAMGSASAPGGVATLSATFPEGQIGVRAVCRGPSEQLASTVTAAFVDTASPACDLTNPAEGSTITPGLDVDHDLANGVQLLVAMGITGSDVDGEPFTLNVTPGIGVAMGSVGGNSGTVEVTLPTTTATYGFALEGRDHAGNTCTAAHDYPVVLDGCDIQITTPTAPVTVDADGNSANGAQVDVGVSVATACEGRTVTSTCGASSPSAVVPVGGQLVLRADVCATSPCETQTTCTVRVSTASGVQTTASTAITFDDLAPGVTVEVVQPALACGSQISPSSDIDPIVEGVQVVAQVSASGVVVTRGLELTTTAGTTSFDAASDVTLTLAPGQNRLVGRAIDGLGNAGQSAACTLALADVQVSFSPPAADGVVNRTDGTVAGGTLTFPLCGTVSKPGASVTVAIDGGAAQPATVNGQGWCRTIAVTETPPSHTIVVSASVGASFGTGTLVLAVDLTSPGAGGDFAASAIDRQRIIATWTAPADGAGRVDRYVVKQATVALTDVNFDVTGTVLATATPASPGTPESLTVFPARTGQTVWLAIASFDPAGNRSVATIAGPITPVFEQTGAIVGPNPSQGNQALGTAIAYGRFDDDAFDDLAVSAPTQTANGLFNGGIVYVYFGGSDGISSTPGLVIHAAARDSRLGSGLAAVRWSSSNHDDLVIGAPGADLGNGRVYVFAGGTLGTGTRSAATAELQLHASATSPGWFASANLGWNLVATDLDGDGVSDLAISAPRGGGNQGGVAMVYGPLTSSVALSDVETSGFAGATITLITDPQATMNRQFGYFLHAVGKTGGLLDSDDDLVISYLDDVTTAGDTAYLWRGDGTRPPTAFSTRVFDPTRDLRLDLATIYKTTEWASQATTIDDLNGDGVRELVVGAYKNLNAGQVIIVDGARVGSVTTLSPGVVLTTFSGSGTLPRFGAAIATHDARTVPDVDGDGREDLLIAGMQGTTATMFVWFGGAIPLGSVSAGSAPYKITGPSTFGFVPRVGATGQARWVGDVNDDGLDDVCWSSPLDNGLDGSFELLWDDRP